MMEELPKWKQELPGVPHKLFNDTFNLVVDYYKEHLRRDTADGRLQPSDASVMLRGFLIAAAQTYASICLVLAEKRPKPFMLQPNVLARSLFEILATVVALTEAPAGRTRTLALEARKGYAARLRYLTGRFGADPKWTDYLEVYRKGLRIIAKTIGVPVEAEVNPDSITASWPTPGAMLRHKPPFVSGRRHAALSEIYDYHYPAQSAQAHARFAALGVAMLVDAPDEQWNPGTARATSSVRRSCSSHASCRRSKVRGQYGHHPKLAELWTYLRDLDDEAKELWKLPYEALANASS